MKHWQHDNLHGLRCRVRLPDGYDPARRYPLVVWLHGSGERGDDNAAQLNNGVTALAAEPLRQFGAVVVAPQAPRNDTFGGSWYGGDSETQRSVVSVVQELAGRRSINADRIYGVGFSMGAIGLWDMVARNPGVFAAAVAIAGDLDVDATAASAASALPIWAVHGERDPLVSNENIRRYASRVGSPFRYTEIKDAGHDVWPQTFAHFAVWQWLFAQRRALPGPPGKAGG